MHKDCDNCKYTDYWEYSEPCVSCYGTVNKGPTNWLSVDVPVYVTKDSIFDIVFGEFCACSDETEQVLNDIIERVRALPAEPVGPMPIA